jgi:hypothetical protein
MPGGELSNFSRQPVERAAPGQGALLAARRQPAPGMGDPCENAVEAPFIMPTDGLVGFGDDSFRLGPAPIDIFRGEDNVTPGHCNYAGFLRRMPDWKSSVIIRIPMTLATRAPGLDLLHSHGRSERLILYRRVPPGTTEKCGGKFARLPGNYSGRPQPGGVHLHFRLFWTMARQFLNELKIVTCWTLPTWGWAQCQLRPNSIQYVLNKARMGIMEEAFNGQCLVARAGEGWAGHCRGVMSAGSVRLPGYNSHPIT